MFNGCKIIGRKIFEAIVDGKSYFCKRLEVKENGDVFVDMCKAINGNSQEVNIVVNGNVESVVNGIGDIEISGDVGGACRCSQGDVSIKGDVSNYVKIGQGDVECGAVVGNVTVSMGDIDCGNVSGSVHTKMGDISVRT
jgi:hypothetical protein